MANDRLMLRCNTCGAEMLIANRLEGEWDMRNVNAIPAFMILHNGTCYWDEQAESNNQFEIYAEMGDIILLIERGHE